MKQISIDVRAFVCCFVSVLLSFKWNMNVSATEAIFENVAEVTH